LTTIQMNIDFDHSLESILTNVSPDRPPVVAIRANDICFQGILRSAHAQGFEAICVHFTWPEARPWYSEKSNLWKNALEIANPVIDPQTAARQLARLGKKLKELIGHKPLAIPSSDTVQLLFFKFEKELGKYFDIYGYKDYSGFRFEVAHKGLFFDQLHNISSDLYPKTVSFSSEEQIKDVSSNATFPCVLKPAVKDFSQMFYRLNNGKKALILNNCEELKEKLYEFLKRDIPLVVQEYIPFESVHDEVPFYCFFDDSGALQFAASGVKRLIEPPKFGTAIVLEFASEPSLEAAAQQLGSAIGWSGPLMIEFIKHKETGEWKIIEVNTRPWLFHDFYRMCGLPFIGSAIVNHHNFYNIQKRKVFGFSPELRKKNQQYIHIDLASYLENFSKKHSKDKLNSNFIVQSIKDLRASVSFAYGSMRDPSPFHCLVDDLAAKYQIDPMPLKNLLVRNF